MPSYLWLVELDNNKSGLNIQVPMQLKRQEIDRGSSDHFFLHVAGESLWIEISSILQPSKNNIK